MGLPAPKQPPEPYLRPLLPLSPRARARASPHPVVVDDVVVCGSHTQQATTTRSLSASERRLSRWLARGRAEGGLVGFVGADRFVARHGAKAILDALHAGVLEWEAQPPGPHRLAFPDWRPAWRIREGIYNPAGLLRRALE